MVGMMGWGAAQQGLRKGPWTSEEDKLLSNYVALHGEGRWTSVARSAGLNRSGKSCRLRWVNYLRPGLKKDQISAQEAGIIIELHALWGNKWSTIARYLPGRTDNEIKNYWRTHFKKRENPSEKAKARVSAQKQQENNMDMALPRTTEIKQRGRTEHNGKQDVAYGSSSTTEDHDHDHQMAFPLTTTASNPNHQDNVALWLESSDGIPVDAGLWGGLWNVDDSDHPDPYAPARQHQPTDDCIQTANHAMNQAAPYYYSSPSDPAISFYNYGGYIF